MNNKSGPNIWGYNKPIGAEIGTMQNVTTPDASSFRSFGIKYCCCGTKFDPGRVNPNWLSCKAIERYRDIIANFLWPELGDMDLENLWFQQDGVTCTKQWSFANGISRNNEVKWPPWFCDFTPLDFFLLV